jgi:hypothetical protein
MNVGTCWGKNTIDPSGRCVEKPRKATLNTVTVLLLPMMVVAIIMFIMMMTYDYCDGEDDYEEQSSLPDFLT